MKKNLLLSFIAIIFLATTNNVKAQLLYTNTISHEGIVPGHVFTAAPYVPSEVLFDDIEIPDSGSGDSITVTQVKMTIYIPASAKFSSYTLFYTTLDETGSGPNTDTSYFKLPAHNLNTVQVAANTSNAPIIQDIVFGDSINTLFKIKVPTMEIVAGEKTFFLGLRYSNADSTGWFICDPIQSPNISVKDTGGLWIYNPEGTNKRIELALHDTLGNTLPNTMAIQVYGYYSGALPVTFLNFDGVIRNNQTLLTWSTASERNNKGFDVEKSADGQTFSSIGFVAGNGTSSNVNNYTFSDDKLVSGNNYYRLKQIDLDGNFHYSSTIKLEFSKFDWTILGNGTGNKWLQLQLDKQSNVSVQIVSLNGKVMQTIKKGSLGVGTYSIPLDLSNAASGMYVVRLMVNNENFTKNIIK